MGEHTTSVADTAARTRGSGGGTAIDRGLRAMAVGRVALGVGSLVAPRVMARALGVKDSGELTYLTRVFGSRAVALGLTYLLGDATQQTRLQRLCLGVDLSDTLDGVGHLVRDDVPRRAMVPMVLLTGSYAAIGAGRALADLRPACGTTT